MVLNIQRIIAGKLNSLIQEDSFSLKPKKTRDTGDVFFELTFKGYKMDQQQAENTLMYYMMGLQAQHYCHHEDVRIARSLPPDQRREQVIGPMWRLLAIQTRVWQDATRWTTISDSLPIPEEVKIKTDDLIPLDPSSARIYRGSGVIQEPGDECVEITLSPGTPMICTGQLRTLIYAKKLFSMIPPLIRLRDGAEEESISTCGNRGLLKGIGISTFVMRMYSRNTFEWTCFGGDYWVLEVNKPEQVVDDGRLGLDQEIDDGKLGPDQQIASFIDTSLCMRGVCKLNCYTTNRKEASHWKQQAAILVASGRIEQEHVMHFVTSEMLEWVAERTPRLPGTTRPVIRDSQWFEVME